MNFKALGRALLSECLQGYDICEASLAVSDAGLELLARIVQDHIETSSSLDDEADSPNPLVEAITRATLLTVAAYVTNCEEELWAEATIQRAENTSHTLGLIQLIAWVSENQAFALALLPADIVGKLNDELIQQFSILAMLPIIEKTKTEVSEYGKNVTTLQQNNQRERQTLVSLEEKFVSIQTAGESLKEDLNALSQQLARQEQQRVQESAEDYTNPFDDINIIFDNAIARARAYNSHKFLLLLNQLKRQTLDSLSRGDKPYTLENAIEIATAARCLAETLDVEAFDKTTKPYRAAFWFNALATALIATALGILAGATLGVGSAIACGMILGSIGFFVGKKLTESNDTFLALRKTCIEHH